VIDQFLDEYHSSGFTTLIMTVFDAGGSACTLCCICSRQQLALTGRLAKSGLRPFLAQSRH
jgi:hypothetical protein